MAWKLNLVVYVLNYYLVVLSSGSLNQQPSMSSVRSNNTGNRTYDLQTSSTFDPKILDIEHSDIPAAKDWVADDYIELRFDGPNGPGPYTNTFKSYVEGSILEILDILSMTLAELSNEISKPIPNHPSFIRYFNPSVHDLRVVLGVFERLLAVLGAPKYDSLRQCIGVSKLRFYFHDNAPGNPPAKCADAPLLDAFYTIFTDPDGSQHGFVMICGIWFAKYRTARAVGPRGLGPSIDPGCFLFYDVPSASSTQILLHEMLHYDLAYAAVSPQIGDGFVVRPENGERHQAFQAFYSFHMKDWSGGVAPTTNADNFVMMALEIYYKKIYNLPFEWSDPPDPLYAPPCPPINIPPPVFYTPPGGFPPPYAPRPPPPSNVYPLNVAIKLSTHGFWLWMSRIFN